MPLGFTLRNGSGKPFQQVILFWLQGEAIQIVFWLDQRRAALLRQFCNKKKHSKSVFLLCYHLQYSFKIVLSVFAFLCVKANPKENLSKTKFSFFPKENADGSTFKDIQG